MKAKSLSPYGTLTAQQVADYHQQGYLVVRGLVDLETVEFAKESIDDYIIKHPLEVSYEEEILKNRKPEALTDEERLLAVRGFHQKASSDDRFLRLVKNASVSEALVSLLGEDIKVLQDMALIKPPFIGSEKPLHQDAAYFEIEPFDQVVGTWWALDRATEENGCMFVWPGTHRLPVVDHAQKEGTPHKVISPEFMEHFEKVALPMEPGDVLLFSSRVFHYTPTNRSGSRRRSLQVHYASAHCRLLPGKKARSYTLVRGATQPNGI
ncbi:MAG: phytanoyl-CoA dioxygenase family protein [Chthoniobacterales bacterium]